MYCRYRKFQFLKLALVAFIWPNFIATSHDRFPPKGSVLEGKSPAISVKSRLLKYYNLARFIDCCFFQQTLELPGSFSGSVDDDDDDDDDDFLIRQERREADMRRLQSRHISWGFASYLGWNGVAIRSRYFLTKIRSG